MPDQPDDRIPPPDSLGRRTLDALGWGFALVVSNFSNLGHTWRHATPRERLRLVVAVLRLVAGDVIAITLGAPTWLFLLLVFFLAFEAISDLDDVATAIAERQKTLRLLATQPTGAPRMAEIQCSRGSVHRFLYGPAGWEEAGPAQHPANA